MISTQRRFLELSARKAGGLTDSRARSPKPDFFNAIQRLGNHPGHSRLPQRHPSREVKTDRIEQEAEQPHRKERGLESEPFIRLRGQQIAGETFRQIPKEQLHWSACQKNQLQLTGPHPCCLLTNALATSIPFIPTDSSYNYQYFLFRYGA